MSDYATVRRKDGSEEQVPITLDVENNAAIWRVVGEAPSLNEGDSISFPPIWEHYVDEFGYA